MNFFDIFEELCKQHDTTVTSVLKEIGRSSSKGTAWRKGSIPSGEILVEIAEYFNVSVDYLLGYTPKMEVTDEKQKIIDLVSGASSEEIEIIYNVAKSVLETVKKSNKN